MGKQTLRKPAQKLKDCIEKTCKVELESSNSELYENNKKDICLFHAMLEKLKEIIKRSTFYIERIQILTQSPFTTERKIKAFGALNHLVMWSRAYRKGNSRRVHHKQGQSNVT